MRASQAHQTVSDALMVMREAFRDQAEVGVNPDGNLVYINPSRKDQDRASRPDPEKVRSVLAAKIENELAAQWRSLDELRRHIKTKLPSLAEIDFKPDSPAIPLLHHEWEELLKDTDPVGRAEFASNKRVMARREKLVDVLRKCLPSDGILTPLNDNCYEATRTPSKAQQEEMLNAFNNNKYRSINTSLNITNQLVNDSRRTHDLQILMPARGGIHRETIHVNHAPAQQTANALKKLTELRHAPQAEISKNSPQDLSDSADRNFMQVLSMVADQTLQNHLSELRTGMLGDGPVLFNPDNVISLRQLAIDNDGNPIITIREETLSRSFVAFEVAIDSLELKSPPKNTPITSENSTFSFKAALTLSKADAEQGILNARFIEPPEMNVKFSLDWQKIDPILAREWP
jgi:hypothetical protein